MDNVISIRKSKYSDMTDKDLMTEVGSITQSLANGEDKLQEALAIQKEFLFRLQKESQSLQEQIKELRKNIGEV